MDKLQEQLNSPSWCELAAPEQNEDLMISDHNKEVGSVSYDYAGSAQNCGPIASCEGFGRCCAKS